MQLPARTSDGTGRIRVLYLGGVGRSGSTLLSRMLGQLPGHCAVGELVEHMWDNGLQGDWPCGCGQPTAKCEFWAEVGRKAFGGWDAVDLTEVLKLKNSIDRTQYIPLLLVPWFFPSFHRRLQQYTEFLTRLYRAVAEVSGARVIVDSSKHPATLYLLRHARGIDLRVALLVRDPRGVAYSWSKTDVRLHDSGDKVRYMPTWGARLAGRRWLTVNAMVAALRWLGVPVIRVRYEDLVEHPLRELERVEALVGEQLPAGGPEFLHGREVELAPTHIVSGNPIRFNTGRVALRQDTAWRQALPVSNRRIVEAVTWPLRRRYGYRRMGSDLPPEPAA